MADPYALGEPLMTALTIHAENRRWSSPDCPICALIDRRAPADDIALVDAAMEYVGMPDAEAAWDRIRKRLTADG